jgi:hypothetical protein
VSPLQKQARYVSIITEAVLGAFPEAEVSISRRPSCLPFQHGEYDTTVRVQIDRGNMISTTKHVEPLSLFASIGDEGLIAMSIGNANQVVFDLTRNPKLGEGRYEEEK